MHEKKNKSKAKKLSKSRKQGFFPKSIFLTRNNEFFESCVQKQRQFFADPKRR